MVVVGVVGAVLFSLAGVRGAGEYILDQPPGGAPGLDGWPWLVLLLVGNGLLLFFVLFFFGLGRNV